MRKITPLQITIFFTLVTLIWVLGIATAYLLFGQLDSNDFRGILLLVTSIFFAYVYAFITFRLFLKIRPLPEGEIPIGSEHEFTYHIYLLFFLIFFYPVMRSGAVPVPIMRLVYQILGARLGENTYSAGIILDPIFVTIGSNTLIGQGSLIVPHVIENERLGHYPIRIGNNVTIGAHSVVLTDVTIEDGALIATGAVVKKGTQVKAGEVWGGVPARRLQGGRAEAEGQSFTKP